jgi:glutathione S-transferase
MPFGQAPAIEVDGKLLAQSAAIDRYLATRAGLVPGDAFAAAKADEAYAFCGDVMQPLYDTFKIKVRWVRRVFGFVFCCVCRGVGGGGVVSSAPPRPFGARRRSALSEAASLNPSAAHPKQHTSPPPPLQQQQHNAPHPNQPKQDADEKIKAREAVVAGPLQDKLKLAAKLVDAAGVDGYVAGPSLTHGDLQLFATLSTLVSGWLDGALFVLLVFSAFVRSLCTWCCTHAVCVRGVALTQRPPPLHILPRLTPTPRPPKQTTTTSTGVPKTVLDAYPGLKAYRNRVASHPKVKAFYERADNQDDVRVAFKPDA